MAASNPSNIVPRSLRLSVEAIIATQMAAVPGLAISDRNRDGLADNRSVFAATAVSWNNPNGGDRVGDDSAAITPALSLPGKNKAFWVKT